MAQWGVVDVNKLSINDSPKKATRDVSNQNEGNSPDKSNRVQSAVYREYGSPPKSLLFEYWTSEEVEEAEGEGRITKVWKRSLDTFYCLWLPIQWALYSPTQY